MPASTVYADAQRYYDTLRSKVKAGEYAGYDTNVYGRPTGGIYTNSPSVMSAAEMAGVPILRPQGDIDPGMVRPPMGNIDPGFVRPSRGDVDPGFVRYGPNGEYSQSQWDWMQRVGAPSEQGLGRPVARPAISMDQLRTAAYAIRPTTLQATDEQKAWAKEQKQLPLPTSQRTKYYQGQAAAVKAEEARKAALEQQKADREFIMKREEQRYVTGPASAQQARGEWEQRKQETKTYGDMTVAEKKVAQQKYDTDMKREIAVLNNARISGDKRAELDSEERIANNIVTQNVTIAGLKGQQAYDKIKADMDVAGIRSQSAKWGVVGKIVGEAMKSIPEGMTSMEYQSAVLGKAMRELGLTETAQAGGQPSAPVTPPAPAAPGTPQEAGTQPAIPGDLNNDGIVDAKDKEIQHWDSVLLNNKDENGLPLTPAKLEQIKLRQNQLKMIQAKKTTPGA